jgi:hypothetical protein
MNMPQIIQSWLLVIVEMTLAAPLDAPWNDTSKSDRADSSSEAKARTDSLVQSASVHMPPWPTLPAPTEFRFTKVDGNIHRDAAPTLASELELQWSPVIGARSYAVQFCDARRCTPPSRKPALRGLFGEDAFFLDLVTVSGTRYVAAGLSPHRQYWFRVIGIDAKGQRGDCSAVLVGSAP